MGACWLGRSLFLVGALPAGSFVRVKRQAGKNLLITKFQVRREVVEVLFQNVQTWAKSWSPVGLVGPAAVGDGRKRIPGCFVVWGLSRCVGAGLATERRKMKGRASLEMESGLVWFGLVFILSYPLDI